MPTALPPPKPLLKSEKEEEVSWREREKEKLRRMAATEVVKSGETEGEGEEQRLLEGVAVLDFDMLCSTVALQAQGKWTKFDHNGNGDDEDSGEFGGVFRMWEGELLDCFEDRRIAIQTAWSVSLFFCIFLGITLSCAELDPRSLLSFSRKISIFFPLRNTISGDFFPSFTADIKVCYSV